MQEVNDNNDGLMLVGIGASAGGVEALLRLFENAPADGGLAYAVVLHTSPEHDSHLAEVLQTKARLPVTQVTGTVKVEPNQVYCLPVNRSVSLEDGQIMLDERGLTVDGEVADGFSAPIDLFFRALAHAYKERAFAVILSGADADGSCGIGRIHEKGGVCLAQDPSESVHSTMPRSAIETGLVDFVLPAADIAAKLVSLRENAERIQLPPAERQPQGVDEDALRELLALLRSRTRHDFSNYKRATLLRRIERRLQVTESEDVHAYLLHIRQHPDELQSLLRDLLISVTNFFRDPEAFGRLETEIVPKLFEGRVAGDQIRVWVSGCATGEEAYSIAMLLAEYADTVASPPGLQVFATDIDEDALAQARNGVYPHTIAADVSPERLKRFFVREGQFYRVRRELREVVLFAPHNILRDPPFSKLSLVSCRNLLIYINRNMQERILEIFHFALKRDGYLFLGTSESADGLPDLFKPLDKKYRIFERVDDGNGFRRAQPPPVTGQWEARRGTGLQRTAPQGGGDEPFSYGELHYRMLEALAPPSVLVNADYDIVHLSERAGRYLRLSGGEPTRNLLRAAHPDLRSELRALLITAGQDGGAASSRVLVSLDGAQRPLRIIVRALSSPLAAPGFMLVLFDEAEAIQALPAAGGAGAESQAVELRPSGSLDVVVRQLETELERTRQHLRASVEEYETSTEELKASNEELQAMNEELRSASEELETGKEELQSVNEELTTINAELRDKVEEIARSNSDLQNLMASTQIGTLFLDRHLRLKRFTPSAQELFNIIPGDIGRPLGHITHRLDYAGLAEDAGRVLRNLNTFEREVTTLDGRVFLARLLPYRTTEDKISGVVITFTDITARKRAEEAQRQSEERMRRVLETEAVGVVFFDHSGAVVDANHVFLKMTGYTRAEVESGELSWRLLTPPEHLAESEAHVRRLEATGRMGPYEKEYILKDGSRRWMLFAGRDLGDGTISEYCIDISDRKRAEAALRESEEQFRRAIEEAPIPVMMHAEDGQVLQISRTWSELTGYALADVPTFDDWLTRAHGEGADEVRKRVRDLFRGELDAINIEFPIKTRGGSLRHWNYSASSPGALRDGRRFVVEMAVDITERKRAEEEARGVEERTRLVVESVEDYAIFTTDTKGRVQTWNTGAGKTFGFTAEEMIGRNCDILFTPEDRKRGVPARERRTARTKGRASDERWHIRKDGSLFYASGVMTTLGDDPAGGYVKVARDLTDRRRVEEELRRAREGLEQRVGERTEELRLSVETILSEVKERKAAEKRARDLVGRLVTAQEDERRRISRDLHDQLGQQLTALRLHLESLKEKCGGDGALCEQIEQVQTLASRIDEEVDFLAWELRPTALDDLGLAAAVTNYAQEWSKHYHIPAEIHVSGFEGLRLAPLAETALYRIAQEALNNTYKHAQAGRVGVMLENRDGTTSLVIEDDGVGFDAKERMPGARGLGLVGMRERAALVGGTIEIETEPGRGTTVFARVPTSAE